MLKIIFQSNQLSVRGTEVAMFDYAFYNEKLLGNRSLIAFNKNSANNNQTVIEKFKSNFSVFGYSTLKELDSYIKSENVDLMYSIKAGERDEVISKVVPTMVHAVFPQHISEIHGSSYAFVSPWLSKVCSNHKVPYVSHMINIPEEKGDLRDELGIPNDAIVFGCYGGYESFDIPFVHDVVREEAESRNDVFFLFMNIKPFAQHKNIIFIPSNSSLTFKSKFINTCNAMLHGRKIGESFGLACGEFSILNKPVITYSKSVQRNHIEVLGNQGFFYGGKRSLKKILREFGSINTKNQSWDCYSHLFSPEVVMEQFKNQLINPALGRDIEVHYELNLIDKLVLIWHRVKLKFIRWSRLWG